MGPWLDESTVTVLSFEEEHGSILKGQESLYKVSVTLNERNVFSFPLYKKV